jgi:iron(III) transport system permease protein
LAAASLATTVGVIVGHDLGRGATPVSRLIDAGFVLTFLLPAAVLGVGVAAAWNRPETSFVQASEIILVLGLVGRYGTLAVRAFAASTAQAAPSLDEAAAIAGARYFRRIATIIVPSQRRGVLAAFGLTLVFCLRDLETTVLFYPPGGEPLTVRIFTLEANGPPGVVAGLAILHTLVTAGALAILAAAFARGRR